MTAVAQTQDGSDRTALRHIVRGAVQLGVVEAGLVLAFSLVSRFLDGPPELVLRSVIVFVGLGVVTMLPGLWTQPRSIEGIAGAAGIGLAAAAVFMVIDVALLQRIGTYTNRWHEIGGGSNWWYHPVWWMTGTFLPWMGAFALANQANRRGAPSPVGALGLAYVLTVVIGLVASMLGFPGADYGLGTFAVAFLPGIVLTVVLAGRGGGRA